MKAIKTTDPKEQYRNEILELDYLSFMRYIVMLIRDSTHDTQSVLNSLELVDRNRKHMNSGRYVRKTDYLDNYE